MFRYDRIVFFLRFKQEIRLAGFIRSIPNLAILDHDAYQNYIPCGEEYCATLNRIRFFVSADVGMGEYMIKSFEAMACAGRDLAASGQFPAAQLTLAPEQAWKDFSETSQRLFSCR